MTFYCKDQVPSDEFMENTLTRITDYVTPSLVYSTPFADTWRAYCDSMLHSLVVVDRTHDVVLLVYTYNEVTKDISARPFAAEYYGTDVIWRIPLGLTNAWNSSETNFAQLSLTICSGIPNMVNKSLRPLMVELKVVELT